MYEIIYTKKAAADIPKLKAAKLDGKAKAMIELIKQNPYQTPPRYERLKGDLEGALSRRINIRHRLVYQVLEEIMTVKIISMWPHNDFQYEKGRPFTGGLKFYRLFVKNRPRR